MKAVELAKSYNPTQFEDKIYQQWMEQDSFSPHEANKESFVIVMPPPNVTGVLHMGHALNNTLQDILIRFYRMQGRKALWIPGTDHAGIATQNVVERELAAKGISRHDLGREAFVKETWKVKERHHNVIVKQLKKMGCSCDWNRERFTLDEGLSHAVREAFVTLYERNLIYKGQYLVNYCPSCRTALSDDEVEHQEVQGSLYQIAYPFADGSGQAVVATTRPETMFGDVAVAVNPNDERYRHLIGKQLLLPLTERTIPIIADEFVDVEFGTGMVKITPAHDVHDYEAGERHNLEKLNILNSDGTLNEQVPTAYQNMDVLSARTQVVADLKAGGFLLQESVHQHEVGHCYRCHNMIEPYLSEQWFVSMSSMAEKALSAWQKGEISFYAKRWENTYAHWLKNIRPWCISRQLWWGHRIPAWYCQGCEATLVLREDPTSCPHCNSTDLVQDEDVLDTWFSSWLWPFSTLGWPEESSDLARFYPTSTLVTGYDIIFFWVSRMIMAGLEFRGEVPFSDIYITGLVRDKSGRKMSKSLGNGIDPLDVIALYGADAMKFTLSYLAAQGQDVLVDMDSFALGSRFANKIWNATRFILLNLEGRQLVEVAEHQFSFADQWIYDRLNATIKRVNESMTSYRFNEAAQALYELFWNDFCDWYVELAKFRLNQASSAQEKNVIVSLLLDLLEQLMRLLHPFLSFISEEIYQQLPNAKGYVIGKRYPEWQKEHVFSSAVKEMELLQAVIRGVRTVRSELRIAPEKKIKVVLRFDDAFSQVDFLISQGALIQSFVGAEEFIFDQKHTEEVSEALPVAGQGYELFLFVQDALDITAERERLQKEIEKTEQLLEAVLRKLSNENFIQRAKPEAIAKERAKQAEFEERLAKVASHLELLNKLS